MLKHILITLFLSMILFESIAKEQLNFLEFVKFIGKGDTTAMQKVVENGFDINTLDNNGVSPLWHAVDANSAKAAKWLLKRGSKVDLHLRTGKEIDPTPFLHAGAKGYTEMIEILLPYQPDVSIRNGYGGSALIPACEKGHVSTVKILLEKSDVDVNLINNLHWTALMEAVVLGDGGNVHQEIIKMLLEHGADITIPDKNGITALTHAEKKGYKEIVKMLKVRQTEYK